jgi:hypothetical protein
MRTLVIEWIRLKIEYWGLSKSRRIRLIKDNEKYKEDKNGTCNTSETPEKTKPMNHGCRRRDRNERKRQLTY